MRLYYGLDFSWKVIVALPASIWSTCLGVKSGLSNLPVVQALLAVLARNYTVELEDPHEFWFQGFKPVNKLPGRVVRHEA